MRLQQEIENLKAERAPGSDEKVRPGGVLAQLDTVITVSMDTWTVSEELIKRQSALSSVLSSSTGSFP